MGQTLKKPALGFQQVGKDDIGSPMAFSEAHAANCSDADGVTLLHWAAFRGQDEVIEFLVQQGGNINATENSGKTALHIAAQWGHIKVLNALLGFGAEVNSQDVDGNSPLHGACQDGRLECVNVLLEHGADKNARNRLGEVPLHVTKTGEVCQVLIEKGCETNVQRVSDGQTPLHVASAKGLIDVVSCFMEYNITSEVEDKSGRTPLQVAGSSAVREALTEVDRKLARRESAAKLNKIDSRSSATFSSPPVTPVSPAAPSTNAWPTSPTHHGDVTSNWPGVGSNHDAATTNVSEPMSAPADPQVHKEKNTPPKRKSSSGIVAPNFPSPDHAAPPQSLPSLG